MPIQVLTFKEHYAAHTRWNWFTEHDIKLKKYVCWKQPCSCFMEYLKKQTKKAKKQLDCQVVRFYHPHFTDSDVRIQLDLWYSRNVHTGNWLTYWSHVDLLRDSETISIQPFPRFSVTYLNHQKDVNNLYIPTMFL